MNTPKIIDTVINNDLCIGCGLCVYACPSNALSMQWNKYGFLIPELSGTCDLNGDCLKVCPFNPSPEKEVRTENELGKLFLDDAQHHNSKIGRYSATYAGYSNEFRLTSSSGGMGTYIFTELLSEGIVDYVLSVKESQSKGEHYEYAISSSKEELLQASKTKYYPVTLAEVMSQINSLDGKVAVVGVACFIKAIRLAQYYEPALKDKIPFLVGIICGGVKSRFFTEYLSSRTGVEKQNIQSPQFRIKDHKSSAGDYSYGCIDKVTQEQKTIKMHKVGDMWGTGLFKANICDFCDDITTELADISLGDAWIEPYTKNGYGTNVIVTRSILSEELIQRGYRKGEIHIENISPERFTRSQRGNFNHRRIGLKIRLRHAKKHKMITPPIRYGNEKVPIDFALVQKLRLKTRKNSLEIWKNAFDAKVFDSTIKQDLSYLSFATKIYHYRREIIRRIKKIINR